MLLIPTNNKSSGKPTLATSRRATLIMAAVVAAVAGLVLILFVSNYRRSVAADGEPARVLVASELIEQGSSGDILATERLFRTASVRADQLKEGAITDPGALRNTVTSRDVLPGQQLLKTDFRPARGSAQSRLGRDHRALALPVDGIHGLKGTVRSGDRVDVYGSFFSSESVGAMGGTTQPVVRRLLRNVLVLKTAAADEGSDVEKVESVTLRVPAEKATHLAFTADNGKIWLSLRPGAGAKDPDAPVVTVATVLRAADDEADGGDPR